MDVVGKRCRVWWPFDREWYPGTVAHWTLSAPKAVRNAIAVGATADPARGWYLVRARDRARACVTTHKETPAYARAGECLAWAHQDDPRAVLARCARTPPPPRALPLQSSLAA